MIIFLLLIFYLSIASAMDIKRRKIGNDWIIYGLISGLLLSSMDAGILGFVTSLKGILYPLPLIILYGFRLLGAGDIKLLMVCGSFLGIENLKGCLPLMLISAGISAIYFMILNNWKLFRSEAGISHHIPLAPAIFLGVVLRFVYTAGTMVSG